MGDSEENARIRHADTQAASIMALTASAVGLLGAGDGFKLGWAAQVVIPVALIIAFATATCARLADIIRSPSSRSAVAWRKAKFIAASLIALLIAVATAGVDVFV